MLGASEQVMRERAGPGERGEKKAGRGRERKEMREGRVFQKRIW